MRIMRYYYCFVVSVLDIDTKLGGTQAGYCQLLKALLGIFSKEKALFRHQALL